MLLSWVVAAAFAEDPTPQPEPAPAPAPDPRDEEIFGPSTPEPAPAEAPAPAEEQAPAEEPAAPSGDRDTDLLGGGFQSSQGRLAETLVQLDQRFTIGGQLWLLAQGNVPEGAQGPEDVTLDGPGRLDLFADARPNDRVRAFASGRLTHDFTVRNGDTDPFTGDEIQADTVLLDQLWIKWDIARRVFVTAGKQRIRWGAGRFWNPTDFLNQQRLDPLAIQDVRTGVDLVKVHVPIESANSNLYAIADLADAQSLDQIGGALRGEWSFGQTELTASAAARKDQPWRLGADLSSGVGPLDVTLEGAALHGVTAPHWEGSFDPSTLTVPSAVDLSDQWLFQVTGGVELSVPYGGDDSFTLGVEGFWNDLGYDDATLLPWLFAEGQFTPLYFGKAYAGAYVVVPGPGRLDDHTFIASAIANLSDGSMLVRLDWRATLMRYLEADAFVAWYGGQNGELHYALAVPAVPGVSDAVSVPAPLGTVGLAAIVRF